MKYNNIIIDCNNLWARAFYITKKDVQRFPDILNKTILLSLKMILKLQNFYLQENGTIWVLADNPTSRLVMRKQLSGGTYKANRLKESDGYYRGIDYLLVLLSNYSSNFKTSRIKHLEADDLVPSILENTKGSSLLVSTDMDWARSIDKNVHWYNTKIVFDMETFKNHFKFFPTVDSITLYKSLRGDTSDNIKGISGITEQVALNIVENFQDVFDVLDAVKKNLEKASLLSERTKKLIKDNERKLIINHNIIYFCEVDSGEIQASIIHGEFNPKSLAILYSSLDFPYSFDSRVNRGEKTFDDIFGDFDKVRRK